MFAGYCVLFCVGSINNNNVNMSPRHLPPPPGDLHPTFALPKIPLPNICPPNNKYFLIRTY